MPLFDLRTFRVLTTLLITAAVLLFVYLARRTLVVFVFAILFAYILEPILPQLEQRFRLTRGRAIAVLYLAMGIGLFVLVSALGPKIVHQAEHLSRILPSLNERVTSGQIAQQIGSEHGWSYATQVRVQHFIAGHQSAIHALEGQIAEDAGVFARNIVWVGLIPILAIFFLKDGKSISSALIDLASRRRQQKLLEGMLGDLHQVMAEYIRAQLLLTAIATGVYLLGFWLLRLQYPFVLGTIAGVLEFIPVVGPLLGAILVLMVALLTGYNDWIPLLVFLGGWRLVQDYVNSPHIMGHKVELHPLAILFGVLVGAEIAGVLGVYLSVPILASLRVVWRRWQSYEHSVVPAEPAAESAHVVPISKP